MDHDLDKIIYVYSIILFKKKYITSDSEFVLL